MIQLKINGYNLFKSTGIVLSVGRETTNSFEVPNDVKPVFSHTWNGFIEYDLNAPVELLPRVFLIKGTLFADNTTDFDGCKMALSQMIYVPYVTIEIPELAIKVNAKLKEGNKWDRLTPLTNKPISANVEFQFNEVMQDVPFIDNGVDAMTFLLDYQGNYYNTQDNKFIIAS